MKIVLPEVEHIPSVVTCRHHGQVAVRPRSQGLQLLLEGLAAQTHRLRESLRPRRELSGLHDRVLRTGEVSEGAGGLQARHESWRRSSQHRLHAMDEWVDAADLLHHDDQHGLHQPHPSHRRHREHIQQVRDRSGECQPAIPEADLPWLPTSFAGSRPLQGLHARTAASHLGRLAILHS